MHTIHEYNEMITDVKEYGSRVGEKNVNFKYAVWWYIADRIAKAKEYIGYNSTYCCEQVISNLQNAIQASRILNLVGIAGDGLLDRVVDFCTEDIEAKRKQRYSNLDEQYSYS